MRRVLLTSALLALLALTAAAQERGVGKIRPLHLRCEYLVTPLAVEADPPRLSWELEPTAAAVRNELQSAWQVRAAGSAEALAAGRDELWDSGRQPGDQTLHVPWAGPALGSRQRVWWQVRVADRSGEWSDWSAPTWFQTGLAAADWQAQWISDPAAVDAAQPAHNGYHSEFTTSAETVKWVQLDLGRSRRCEQVVLYPARPYDWQADLPGFMFPVRYRLEASDDPQMQGARLLVDRTTADQPNPGTAPVTLTFDAVSARYLRLTATRLNRRDGDNYGLSFAEIEVLDGPQNVARETRASASDSLESGSWSLQNLTNGDRLSHPAGGQEALPVTLLRSELTLPAVRRATLYATALGAYRCRVNGQSVSDAVLAPEWTSYHQRLQYQAYDVTALLREGPNCLAALLGDGWYAGRIGMAQAFVKRARAVYGRRTALRVQLDVELADGTRRTFGSDATWRVTRNGSIRSADIYDGTVEDGRQRLPGWDQVGFETAAWSSAAVLPAPPAKLVAQPNEPIRPILELPPVALTEPQPGVHVYDFGQNLVGRARLTFRGPAGTAVRLRHAEMLNDDGTVYVTNLRGAPQIDRYTLAGSGEEVFEPEFTYHGFRYLELTGLPAAPRIGDAVGVVFCSAAPEVAQFECSDASLNRLQQNLLWTQRANFMSTPTDCPQRDERLGWMGDILAYGQTAAYMMDLGAFYTKWLRDVRDDQATDGRFPDFAPQPYDANVQFSGVPGWGDAGVFVPWLCWTQYGDRRVLQEMFAPICRWVDWIAAHNPNHLWQQRRYNDYGDWLNGDTLIAEGWPKRGGEMPKDQFATTMYFRSTQLAADIAKLLDRPAEEAKYRGLAEQIREAFQRTWLTADFQLRGATQAGYAMALNFDLIPAAGRAQAVEHLVGELAKYRDHISTGFHSTHRLMLELSDAGRGELAWKLLTNRTFPSWLYSIDNGATTIWERWDGYVKGRGFQNPGMNSFNHWALGAVGEWIFQRIGGLRPDPSRPAWQHVQIAPTPGGGVSWSKCSYRSPRGLLRCDWRREGGVLHLSGSLPPNVTATLILPPGQALVNGLAVTGPVELGSGEWQAEVR
ncbi:MAG: family 78 glycoside hydrolase catalytic domain [Fimbriimonadaceae bacterium]|nr:family 78 glycoside hydrolase catalytic domain [Fimbriimonadaceae bacterium]